MCLRWPPEVTVSVCWAHGLLFVVGAMCSPVYCLSPPIVMNPVATHHTAHHPWTTSPIMHCTHTFPSTITPITQLSPFTHHSDCHTCTSFTHINAAHKHSPSAKSCFALATFLSVLPRICYLCVWPRTAWPWTSEPVPVTSTPAWYCLRLCSASDIPVMPSDHCLCDSAFVQ